MAAASPGVSVGGPRLAPLPEALPPGVLVDEGVGHIHEGPHLVVVEESEANRCAGLGLRR